MVGGGILMDVTILTNVENNVKATSIKGQLGFASCTDLQELIALGFFVIGIYSWLGERAR